MPTLAGQAGRLSPCAAGCGYLDIVRSHNDTRVRHFGSSTVVVWDGSKVNETSHNNAGQHPEPALSCELAAYYIDEESGVIEQWLRDVETGEDIELRWSAEIGTYLENYHTLAGGYSYFLTPVYQSYDGKIAIFMPPLPDPLNPGSYLHEGAVEVRDFDDGSILASATVEFNPGSQTSRPFRMPDILPYEDSDDVLRLIAWHDSGDSLPVGFEPDPLIKYELNGTQWDWNAETCSGFGAETRLRTRGLGAINKRPGIARYNGLWTYAVEGDTGSSSNEPYKSTLLNGRSVCNAVADSTESSDDLGVPAFARFSSPYCQKIYHILSSGLFAGGDISALRYDPATKETEKLPFAEHSEGFWPTGDWLHVVKDQHALPNGDIVQDVCDPATKCGDDSSDADRPECCESLVLDVVFGFEACDSPTINEFPENKCLAEAEAFNFQGECVYVQFTIDSFGCGNITSWSIYALEHDLGAVPNRVEPCYGPNFTHNFPDLVTGEAGFHFDRLFCKAIVLEVKTDNGCDEIAVIYPQGLNQEPQNCPQ